MVSLSIKRDGQRGLKNMTQVYAVYKKLSFKNNNILRLKMKGKKKIYLVNINQQKAGVAILISDKIVFKILQTVILYDMKISPLMQHNNLKRVCSEQQSCSV